MASILIIDDESAIRITLRMILEHEGYEVDEAENGYDGLEMLRLKRPDLVLLDIKMPGMDGLEVLKAMPEPRPAVVILSGHGTIGSAVEATRLGAADFLEKPPQKERILLSVVNALKGRRLEHEAGEYRALQQKKYRMVGDSVVMLEVRERIKKVAGTNASVLITGESGTGKELVAREVHALSPRATRAFIHVNCAAIPESLIENELFGHEKGAYTGAGTRMTGKFEQADRGTIFLDEVGDMSLTVQAKVLRVLQDGEFQRVGGSQVLHTDVRVVSATNKDLGVLIGEGKFREDLYFRLNVVPVQVPPLRERREDIAQLVRFFAGQFAEENGFPPPEFDGDALRALRQHDWPGNVRELKNTVERALIMGPRDGISVRDLQLQGTAVVNAPAPWLEAESLQEFKEESEKAFILRKLKENDWNIKATAEAIDTPRSNLYKKLRQYGIETP
ncbi:sigma-54-dependent Fis family transcriptional regulator [bacterium]|nr:sigma-54-dependent Fis family transcriptional regulator [candidate division CSSED10-310 bacterium]